MSYSHQQHGQGEAAKLLRKEAGKRLKAMREAAGLTQRELAQKVGFEYYTMISQIEGGKTRMPPQQIAANAKAVQMPVKDFAKVIMQYYDPIMFEILFTNKHKD